jgi:hypothetical protein
VGRWEYGHDATAGFKVSECLITRGLEFLMGCEMFWTAELKDNPNIGFKLWNLFTPLTRVEMLLPSLACHMFGTIP